MEHPDLLSLCEKIVFDSEYWNWGLLCLLLIIDVLFVVANIRQCKLLRIDQQNKDRSEFARRRITIRTVMITFFSLQFGQSAFNIVCNILSLGFGIYVIEIGLNLYIFLGFLGVMLVVQVVCIIQANIVDKEEAKHKLNLEIQNFKMLNPNDDIPEENSTTIDDTATS